jgi:polysaccharide biosynthesis transport protein
MTKNDTVEGALLTRRYGGAVLNHAAGNKLQQAPFGMFFYDQPRTKPGFHALRHSLGRHKLALWTVVILITALAAFINLRAKSTYLASTTLVVGNEGPANVKMGELLQQNQESEETTMTAIKTNMVMMKSHELLEDVIVDLQLDRNPKFLAGQNQGLLDRVLNLSRGRTSSTAESAKPVGSIGAAEEEPLRPARERARLDPWVRAIENNLSVEQIGQTRALKVSFVHTDPEIAAAVANGVAQHFGQRAHLNQTEIFTNAASWLMQSTEELKRRVEEAEQSLADYSRANNIFTIEGSSTLPTDKLSKLQDQVTRAEADRIIKEALYEQVKLGREIPGAFDETVSKSAPRIMDLEKQLGDLMTNEAQLSAYFGPANPQLQAAREQIAAVKEQIAAERETRTEQLRTAYESSVREEQGLQAALAKARAEAVNENQAVIQYNILKQEAETAKELYREFLQKSSQAQMQINEQQSNLRIVDRAKVPTVAHGPRRAFNIAIWFTIALLAGAGLALLLDLPDHALKNVDDVKQLLQLPTLAVVPHITAGRYQSSPRLPERPGPASSSSRLQAAPNRSEALALTADFTASQNARRAVAEAYYALRASVLFSSIESGPKTILITSSKPGDGKSTTVLNLGFSLCELEARVLIIDANMRHSTIHQTLGLGRNSGLSTYLSRNVAANRLIQRLGNSGLSFLPAGPIHPDPASLLSSPRMRSLLELLSEEYDYILIDSPSLAGVSDAAILSTMADGVVLVVQGGKSRRDVVSRAKNDLMRMGARVMGVVLNNIH